jgi:hypothetical protein
MVSAQNGAGFKVDVAVFEELRRVYGELIENVGTARSIAHESPAASTGLDSVDAWLQQLSSALHTFLSATSKNLTLDRDALATARDNYQRSDAGSAQTSRSFLERLVDEVVDTVTNTFPFGSPTVPLLRPLRVSGPADQVGVR